MVKIGANDYRTLQGQDAKTLLCKDSNLRPPNHGTYFDGDLAGDVGTVFSCDCTRSLLVLFQCFNKNVSAILQMRKETCHNLGKYYHEIVRGCSSEAAVLSMGSQTTAHGPNTALLFACLYLQHYLE